MKWLYLLFMSGWLFLAPAAFACSCILGEYASDYVNDRTIFYGHVYKTELIEGAKYRAPNVMTSFNHVKTVYPAKRLKTKMNVKHSIESSTCGIEFDLGWPSVVFAYSDDKNELVTGLCAGPQWPGVIAVLSYLETGQDHKIMDFYCGEKFHQKAGGEEIISCDDWYTLKWNEVLNSVD